MGYDIRIRKYVSCKTCIYYNGHGGCWARKGKADFGAVGCDYRVDEEALKKEMRKERRVNDFSIIRKS